MTETSAGFDRIWNRAHSIGVRLSALPAARLRGFFQKDGLRLFTGLAIENPNLGSPGERPKGAKELHRLAARRTKRGVLDRLFVHASPVTPR